MSRKGPSTIGVATFDPDTLYTDLELHQKTRDGLNKNNVAEAIRAAFNLSEKDTYPYRAGNATVTLDQTQSAVDKGPANGLCAWYPSPEIFKDEDGTEKRKLSYPSPAEVAAYISLFDPSKSATNVLKGYKANAKKNSLQSGVMDYLSTKRYIDPSAGIVVAKTKKGHPNVYADFWTWSCMSLRWAGPNEYTKSTHTSHHVLPVFMHHFGCVCPSYESIEIIRSVSRGCEGFILDVGSGNGYWTYMLRRSGLEVRAIDNGQSTWRTLWIDDTVNDDAAKYIKTRRKGGKDDVLLMVYPVVGLDFTVSVLNAYKGDVICVVGTQNGNGYTGFKDEMIDQWMARERTDFERIVQVPLPSFAGKDEALFVFRRKSQTVEGEQNGTEKANGNGL